MGKRKIIKSEAPSDKEHMLCPACGKHKVSFGFWRAYRKCVICYYGFHSY